MNKNIAINDAKNIIIAIALYVAHYTSSIWNQAMSFEQITSRTPKDLQYVERKVFMKEVNTQKDWSFKIEWQGFNVPIWTIVGFQQRKGQNSQNQNKDTFYRPPARSSHCIIGTERHPDSAILLMYDDDYYSQGYGRSKEAFEALTQDNILQPNISDNDLRSSKDHNKIG